VVYDYRGYGISKATKNEQTLNEDLEIVIAFCQEGLKVPLNKMVLWGFSIGTAPTVDIASRYFNIAGIVLQAPLASLRAWFESNLPWDANYTTNDSFCSLHKIESVKGRIFIMHGNKDEVINVRHSHLLFERFKKAGMDESLILFIEVEGISHNDIQSLVIDIKSDFYLKMKRFLHDLFVSQKPQPEKIQRSKAFFNEREKETLNLLYSNLRVDLD
jgi:fermentation-respiration switch protein FrsA (DUF1100 family)